MWAPRWIAVADEKAGVRCLGLGKPRAVGRGALVSGWYELRLEMLWKCLDNLHGFEDT